MRLQEKGLALVMVVVAALAFTTPAAAQEVPAQQEPVEVTDSLLEEFATIYPTVAEVSREAQAELSEAADQAEAQRIQAEANEEIMDTLDEAGMTFEEYDGVIRAVNDDPELMEKFEALMLEIHGGEGDGPGV